MSSNESKPPSQQRNTAESKRVFPLLIAGIILLIAFFVVQASVSSGGSFSLSIADLLKNEASLVGKNVKVEGRIKENSVRAGKDEFDIFFVVEDDNKNEVQVHYTKVLPDPFQEGRTAIVEGAFQKGAKIEASKLTVKCPSKYKREDMSKEEYEEYLRENPEHTEPRS